MPKETKQTQFTRTDIVYRITPPRFGIETFYDGCGYSDTVSKIIVDHKKKITNEILESFYKLAVAENYEIFLIDESEFKRFVEECLPEWIKGQKSQQVLEILRKNLDLEIIDVCKTYGIYKVHIANLHQELTIDENEFKLVKEWIENGKKGI